MNCYNKSTFKSLKHAKNVARHFARNLYAYYCYDCRGWHLTHRKKFYVKYNIKANNMKHRQFRVVVKRRNDCVYFINIDNPDDFYVYETAHFNSVRANHIYRESQLHIEGRFVKNILS